LTTLRGIDVSHWQATTPSLTGLAFLFARATYGTQPDDKYATHIKNARSRGLLVGAYHFGRNLSVSAQVTAFLNRAGNVDFYVLDWESDSGNPKMTTTQARNFIALVKSATGKPVGLYASESGFRDLGQDYNWVAKWGGSPPTIPYAFWQYRGSPLDLDLFNGDIVALRKLAGKVINEMRNYTITPEARGGTIKVTEAGHWFLDMTTDKLDKLAVPFERAPAWGPVHLTDTIDHQGSDPARRIGYIGRRVAGTPFFVLATDCVFIPDPNGSEAEEKLAAIRQIIGE
jgi:hypothetical protein